MNDMEVYMGIFDIMFENMKVIEYDYLNKNHVKSGNEYLIAVFSEIIKNNNYNLILDKSIVASIISTGDTMNINYFIFYFK